MTYDLFKWILYGYVLLQAGIITTTIIKIVILKIKLAKENKHISQINECDVYFGKLKSPAEVAMNPPRLPSPEENKELGYRETSHCHHCGCDCGKVIVKEVINECEDCYMPEDDCNCFGPPL